MAERIGNVLYWLGCIAAGLTALFGLGVYLAEGHSKADGIVVTGFMLVAAFVFWLTGRACRYILGGR